MPEARLILKDLSPWLKRSGYLRLKTNDNANDRLSAERPHYLIFVRPGSTAGSGYLYWLQTLGERREGKEAGAGLGNDLEAATFFGRPGVRVINLGAFLDWFLKCLK